MLIFVCVRAELQLKLKQKYEKMEKQRENSARVDSILIQLMKKHAPEIAEKLENNNNNAVAAAGAPGAEDPAAIKREGDAAAGAEATKRQKLLKHTQTNAIPRCFHFPTCCVAKANCMKISKEAHR